ncbi:hypothetical protein KVR01_009040 [Diaporthe batatas]|uniref:uncharacterized protein n=1 Tax=Diaporthe batatas TaxID=748121 RepID=UPI001D04DCDB|nr:uncharacterized protein KVR01_009040 [Diaporthe batatas]KAG8160776.1 hypothetical protein KVR01_009040 [Diaporthe batatas]
MAAPNDDGSFAVDDFVLVDSPAPAIQGGYVNVSTDNSVITAYHDTLSVPMIGKWELTTFQIFNRAPKVEVDNKKVKIDNKKVEIDNKKVEDDKKKAEIEAWNKKVRAMLQSKYPKPIQQGEHEEVMMFIDGFDPMPASAFPESMKKVLLKAADPANHQKVRAISHLVLIKNATVLVECFCHFKHVEATVGRQNLFALVSKACGVLEGDDFPVVQECVREIIQALADARHESLHMGQDRATWQLALAVDKYKSLKAYELPDVEETWFDNKMVKKLWNEWMTKVDTKAKNVMDGSTETGVALSTNTTGDEITDLLAATSLATRRVYATLKSLQARREHTKPTPRQVLLLRKIQTYSAALTSEIDGSYSQAPTTTTESA